MLADPQEAGSGDDETDEPNDPVETATNAIGALESILSVLGTLFVVAGSVAALWKYKVQKICGTRVHATSATQMPMCLSCRDVVERTRLIQEGATMEFKTQVVWRWAQARPKVAAATDNTS